MQFASDRNDFFEVSILPTSPKDFRLLNFVWSVDSHNFNQNVLQDAKAIGQHGPTILYNHYQKS